ncbi:hypothetical protein FZX09_04040 [Synechococcus sp. MU1643]|uniref:hypothetical protein n=1 Tax=Synechococcus sp. MU1643 TaxID=2508349 RepID=UPI001CF8F182|nr:hypothetical protein [Synechococcus sp. MU1643]MCB4427983.1 hypothetical protein [Synechococcus sp. MU1643]
MPTSLDRVQVLLQPDVYADVMTLAKHNRRSASAMCAELVEAALKRDKYQDQLDDAQIKVPAQPDPRHAIRQTQLRSYVEVTDGPPTKWWQVQKVGA